jgi:hypothetical protein
MSSPWRFTIIIKGNCIFSSGIVELQSVPTTLVFTTTTKEMIIPWRLDFDTQGNSRRTRHFHAMLCPCRGTNVESCFFRTGKNCLWGRVTQACYYPQQVTLVNHYNIETYMSLS